MGLLSRATTLHDSAANEPHMPPAMMTPTAMMLEIAQPSIAQSAEVFISSDLG